MVRRDGANTITRYHSRTLEPEEEFLSLSAF